jgi:penicillin-binding protein 1A
MKVRRFTIAFGFLGLMPGAFAGLAVHEGRDLASGKQAAFAAKHPQVAVPASVIVSRDKRQFLDHAKLQLAPQVAYSDIPKACVHALLAWEDARFLSHPGFDWFALARAGAAYAARRPLQGGSTLTQQLVKTKLLQADRHGLQGMRRKLRELILAIRLEREMSKNTIIETYFNNVYLGTVDGTDLTGLQQAATFYFQKNATDLNRYECAVLVGSLASPNTRNYYAYPETAHGYAAKVIAKMVSRNFILPREGEIAIRTRSKPGRVAFSELDGRYFLSALADEAFRLGSVGNNGDIRFVVTVDFRDQLLGENLVCKMTESLGRSDLQGALVAMTISGEVRALVGGCDFASNSFNRATQAKRQPGSAFKPFVYASAMELGLSPRTIRNDLPLNINGWEPKNANGSFRGPVTLQTAFADSINTVAVRLTLEVGVTKIILKARAFGINSEIKPNLTIGLGTAEVNLLELTGSYIPFVGDGRRVEPHLISMAISAGRVVGQKLVGNDAPVLSKRVQAEMRQLFEAVVRNGTGKRSGPDAGGGKTGTTQGQRDAWFVGWRKHDSLLVGIWAGSDSNNSIPGLSGGGLPVETWRQFASAASREQDGAIQTPVAKMSLPPIPADAIPACRRYPNLC